MEQIDEVYTGANYETKWWEYVSNRIEFRKDLPALDGLDAQLLEAIERDGAVVTSLDALGLSSLAILAGLVPLTMAGVGTRDAATIYLFAPFLSAAAGAVLGLMLTLRYILPGLAGLPFLADYIDVVRK